VDSSPEDEVPLDSDPSELDVDVDGSDVVDVDVADSADVDVAESEDVDSPEPEVDRGACAGALSVPDEVVLCAAVLVSPEDALVAPEDVFADF